MVALAFSVFLLALAGVMAFGRYPFSAANVLFCMAWGAMLLLYRLFGFNYEYLLWVIAFTIACVSAWIAGEAGAGWLYRREHIMERRARRSFQIRYLTTFLFATTAIGMIAPVDWVATSGMHLSEITNIGGLLDAAQDAHIALSQQRVEQSMVNKLCLMVALAGVTMAGIHIGTGQIGNGQTGNGRPGRKTPAWLLAAPVVPYLTMMLLTTVRSMMVVPAVMFFASWIAGLALSDNDRAIFDPKRLRRLALVGAVMAVVIVYLQGVRAGDYTFSRVGDTMVKMRLWTAGYEPALVSYMRQAWDHRLQYGASSFRVFTGLLGGDNAALAYGADQMDIGMNDKSNAMTALRFILEDWGMGGAVVFCLLWGALTGLAGEATRTGKLWLAPLYALLVAVALFSPNSWFLNYGTRCFAPVLAMLYLLAFGRVRVVDSGWQRPARRRRRRSAKAGDEDSAEARRALAARQLGISE